MVFGVLFCIPVFLDPNWSKNPTFGPALAMTITIFMFSFTATGCVIMVLRFIAFIGSRIAGTHRKPTAIMSQNIPPIVECPPVIRQKTSVWRILFGSLQAFMVKLCLVAVVVVVAGLFGRQQCWSAKVKAGLTQETLALSEQPLLYTNIILTTYRRNVPTDNRQNGELMMLLGQDHDRVGSYAAYPDFVMEWQIAKAKSAVIWAPEMAQREPSMVAAYWAGYTLPWAVVIIFGVSAAFNGIVWLARR